MSNKTIQSICKDGNDIVLSFDDTRREELLDFLEGNRSSKLMDEVPASFISKEEKRKFIIPTKKRGIQSTVVIERLSTFLSITIVVGGKTVSKDSLSIQTIKDKMNS